MEAIKAKIATLRAEADAANDRAEQSQLRVKELEAVIVGLENDVKSLSSKNAMLEAENNNLEGRVAAAKTQTDESLDHRSTSDALSRKVAALEQQLEVAEAEAKEFKEKNRDVEVKIEVLERKVLQLESERDTVEAKLEEKVSELASVKAELDELVSSVGGL
ncbi:hypothetical protein GQ42DRAFT_161019 [Ramicandelaber brevisporus]|nr:hypothetical protein GQ42DRAFT_161019 [Ramicandelaber brevisporus]